jgi:endothelin-converting enzyme/putative endopeptidase
VFLLAVAGSLVARQAAPTSGLDPSRFDRTVRPQDDLFRHVNGGWLAATDIPAEFPVYGSFVELNEKVEADLYALIEELAGDRSKQPGSTAQQVGDLFAAFVDQPRLDELGAAPLRRRLQEIDGLQDAAGFASLTGRLSRLGLPGPVGAFVNADAGDPSRVILYLFQAGTALPDRDYYLEDTPQFRAVRQKYVEYLR